MRIDTSDPFICGLPSTSSESSFCDNFVTPSVRFRANGYTRMVGGREAAINVVEGEEEPDYAGQEEDFGPQGREMAERSYAQVYELLDSLQRSKPRRGQVYVYILRACFTATGVRYIRHCIWYRQSRNSVGSCCFSYCSSAANQ